MRRSSLLVLLAMGPSACGASSIAADASTDRVVAEAGTDAALDGTSDRAEPACDVPWAFTFGFDGGFSAFVETSRLEPGRGFTWTRSANGRVDAGALTCATTLAYCGSADGGAIDTLTVINALGDADVTAALADQTTTLYGVDPRPVDGQVYAVRRADGRHVEIGSACSGGSGCREIPAGLARLRTALTALTAQELARPECASARP